MSPFLLSALTSYKDNQPLRAVRLDTVIVKDVLWSLSYIYIHILHIYVSVTHQNSLCVSRNAFPSS